jgi:transposase
MEAKTTRKRKKHSEEFKREAVRLLETRGERTVADVAGSLGVAENLLHAWKKKFGSAAEQLRKERGGETPEDELKRLRREVTQLKQERDVLKKSVAFFARDRS